MTEEIVLTSNEKEMTRGAAGLETIQRTMDQFLSAAKVEAVYGQPILHGDTVIIPSAEVISVMGFGLGSGVNTDQDQVGKKENNEGMGGGGGGRVFSRPVAVIVASPEGVRIEPVADTTKVILAALTTLGFMVGMIARMYKPTKSKFN
jgi:uncharacterized spore protein YtfJ